MKAEEFVDTVRTYIVDAAVRDTMSLVTKPPGMRPPQDLLELSAWLRGLSEGDRDMTRRMLTEVAREVAFAILSVLDGVRKVFDVPASDYFELAFVHGEQRDVLSGRHGPLLNEIFRSYAEEQK